LAIHPINFRGLSMNRLDQSAWTFALFISGVTAGMFLMDFFGYYPALSRLPDQAMIEVHQQSLPLRRLIFRVGIGSSAVATLVLLISFSDSRSRRLLLANVFCLVAVILFTNLALVPLNEKISTWATTSPPAGWKLPFSQMIARERLRSFLPAVAFVLQLLASAKRNSTQLI
jgi:uncharacterized membrane protein